MQKDTLLRILKAFKKTRTVERNSEVPSFNGIRKKFVKLPRTFK